VPDCGCEQPEHEHDVTQWNVSVTPSKDVRLSIDGGGFTLESREKSAAICCVDRLAIALRLLDRDVIGIFGL
jgi:hypothetical protein